MTNAHNLHSFPPKVRALGQAGDLDFKFPTMLEYSSLRFMSESIGYLPHLFDADKVEVGVFDSSSDKIMDITVSGTEETEIIRFCSSYACLKTLTCVCSGAFYSAKKTMRITMLRSGPASQSTTYGSVTGA